MVGYLLQIPVIDKKKKETYAPSSLFSRVALWGENSQKQKASSSQRDIASWQQIWDSDRVSWLFYAGCHILGKTTVTQGKGKKKDSGHAWVLGSYMHLMPFLACENVRNNQITNKSRSIGWDHDPLIDRLLDPSLVLLKLNRTQQFQQPSLK